MAFQPQLGEALFIGEIKYSVTEHPLAPGMPYGQEGRRAVVCQLEDEDKEKYALKVFKARFRVPGMVSVAETLESYASLEGLQACQRTVLTGSRHQELLREYPDLTYSVLMPWVEGPTWQEMLLEPEDISQERSLEIARAFSKLLMILEEKRLAHCDLSGANLIIQPGDTPALVDLEEMYGPGFLEPKEIPAGSPGYAHKSAPRGIWSDETDRFAGAVLLSEMLCWHDPIVREASWGESYFAPKDMQTENQRLDVLQRSLEKYYGKRILDLFNQAWRSDSLRDCPTFAEWAVALPEKVKEEQAKVRILPRAEESNLEEGDALSYYIDGQSAAEKGDLDQALDLYRKAITLAPPSLSKKIENRIKLLEDRIREEEISEQPEPITEEVTGIKYPARSCPVCGMAIPEGQEVCPHCEGKPRDHQERPSAPEGRNPKVILFRVGAGLIFVSGIILILLGRGGSGPLSSLETGKQTPTGTATSTLIPTATQPPTEAPSPTETPTPSVTPTPSLDAGSTQVSSKDGMVQMYIPAGEFLMGSEVGYSDEEPVHTVYLDAYYIDQYEVTNAAYRECVETGTCDLPEQSGFVYLYTYYGNPAYGEYPVINVSWHDARAYCEWAGRRLPTEAEWEKAARGTDGRVYPWGDEFDGTVVNFCDQECELDMANTSSNRFPDTVPVGSYPGGASPYRVYDMAGNVWEYVSDWYDEDYYGNSPSENPQGPSSGQLRGVRGGSWYYSADRVRTAYRIGVGPDFTDPSIGFRCAASE